MDIQRYGCRHIPKLFMTVNPLMASSNLDSGVRTEEAMKVLLIPCAPEVNIQSSQGSIQTHDILFNRFKPCFSLTYFHFTMFRLIKLGLLYLEAKLKAALIRFWFGPKMTGFH